MRKIIVFILIFKGCDEEEYALPLARESDCRDSALGGRLKERMQKVASEPERPKEIAPGRCSRVVPVTGQRFANMSDDLKYPS